VPDGDTISLVNEEPRAEPILRSPPVVVILIGLIAAIHVVLWYLGEDWQFWALYALAFIPARFTDPAFAMIPGSQYWSFITHAFLHGDAMHLIFNALWLLVFGTVTARRLGAVRFLVLAGVSAAGGALTSLVSHWGEAIILIGASGAVSGMLGAAMPIMFGPGMRWGSAYTADLVHAQILRPSQLLRHRNALVFGGVWLAITLYSGATGWTGMSFVEEGGIAWEAHLGGFIAGLLGFYALDHTLVRD
jgi:membrane associated rhomboid family serine protease